MTLRQLLVAATVALAAAGASAQSTSSPTAQPPRKDALTQADRDFEAAKAACQAERSRTARLECVQHAQDSYSRATGTSMTPFSGMGGSASGTQQNGSARARS